MPAYVTATGFSQKRQDEIKTDLQTLLKGIFGDDVQLSEQSDWGQIVGIFSEYMADGWEMAGEVYDAFHVGAVIGRVQELLYELNGIQRNQAIASTVDLLITGTIAATVPATFQAATSSGLTFQVDAADVIGGGGTVTVSATCTETGPNEATASTVTNIVTPSAGIASATNPAEATPGRYQESNAAFRLRQILSTGTPGQNLLESLFGQLSNLDEVTAVRIYQNRTNVTDGNGLPPHSFMPIVQGGADADIAPIVWVNSPAGIGSVGSTAVIVTDAQGYPVSVSFQRPTETDIYVDITIVKDSSYPADGDETIRTNIILHAAGLLIEDTNFAGFGIGEDIELSRIYTPTNLIQGHYVSDLKIGLSFGAVAASNLSLAFDAIGNFDITRIKINGVTG
jgi:uncharacterized phage protein gp47/JayE